MTSTRSHRRSRWAPALALLSLALVAGACGTRLEHADVVAAAGSGPASGSARTATGTASELQPGAGGEEVTGSDGATGTDGAAVDVPGSGGTTGGGAGGTTGAGGSGGTTGASAAKGAKSPVTIASVGTLSGPVGGGAKVLVDGVRSWVQFINANGGVNGHPVQHVVADDGGDPARHRALVQQMVEERGVIAFVGNPDGLTGAQSKDYLTKAGVPVIGGDGGGQWFNQSPTYFPQGPHGDAFLTANGSAIATTAVADKMPKTGLMTCVEAQVCRDAAKSFKALFPKFGAQIVYTAEASIGQPDYTAECLSARNAGVQVFALGMDGNSILRVAQSCARQNFRPVFAYAANTALPSHAKEPALENAILANIVATWASSASPALAEYQKAMSSAGIAPEAGNIVGWVAGKLFEFGARQLPEPATRAAMLDGLWTIPKGTTLGGLTGPLSFERNKPATPSFCSSVTRLRGGKFAALRGAEIPCY